VRAVPDQDLEPDLTAVRAALGERSSGSPARRYLLGRFTLADVAIIAALQAIRPHPLSPAGLGPAQREAWSRPALAARWEDLLAWRDEMIEAHRRQPSP
jgi:glutathione S-transferase